jgi:cell division protein FtsA
MILAQFIEKSGLRDQMGAGVVLTGGFSKMEGIRDLAVATFGSMPVRLARPIEMDGLFDSLREPEYSSAIGLIMYASYPYTPYEIDVNKRVRHANETPTESVTVNLSDTKENFSSQLETKQEEKMVSLEVEKGKKSDEAGSLVKFWNWATQLF